MIKTLKNFGVLCAVESVVAVTFLVTAAMCAGVGAIDGVVVSLLVSGGAVGLGLLRYRNLTAPVQYAAETTPVTLPKPARRVARKVVKKGKTKK